MKAAFRPTATEAVLELMTAIAAVDGRVDDCERKLILETAQAWDTDASALPKWEQHCLTSQCVALMAMKRKTNEVLGTSPTTGEVETVLDLIEKIVSMDGVCDDTEAVALAETGNALRSKLGDVVAHEPYQVVAVPRSKEQSAALIDLCSTIHRTTAYGGTGVALGSYFTDRCARAICQAYRSLDLFVTIIDRTHETMSFQQEPRARAEDRATEDASCLGSRELVTAS